MQIESSSLLDFMLIKISRLSFMNRKAGAKGVLLFVV